jgi:hypothetical protein
MAQNQLYDIYPTWHVPFWQTTWFFWLMMLIGSIILAALITGFIMWKRKYKKPKTAWEQALSALNLLGQRAMHPRESKEFYTQLTSILKRYLQERYEIPVMGKTDQELIASLESLDVLKDAPVLLQEVIEGSTIIKFANVQSGQERMHQDLDRCRVFITTTIPSK